MRSLYWYWDGVDDLQAVPLGSETGMKIQEVAVTDVPFGRVSTVFLGIDHNHAPFGAPILFETMCFGTFMDQDQWRYCTAEEARKGHKKRVRQCCTPLGVAKSLLMAFGQMVVAHFRRCRRDD